MRILPIVEPTSTGKHGMIQTGRYATIFAYNFSSLSYSVFMIQVVRLFLWMCVRTEAQGEENTAFNNVHTNFSFF